MITPQYLLEGAMYALEQCGVLLHDAVTLYDNRSYSNAIVLAAFAREEIGRSLILRELRRDIIERGMSVTVKDIVEKCKDHPKKQEYAQLSVTLRFSSHEERLAQLFRVRIHSHPQSDEWKRADKELNEISKRQKKRIPNERNNERMRSLYVEPNEFGTRWNRPREKSHDEAEVFLVDAVNDYGVEYDYIQRGSIQYIDEELFHALQAWPERPELPLPQWPEPQWPRDLHKPIFMPLC